MILPPIEEVRQYHHRREGNAFLEGHWGTAIKASLSGGRDATY